MYIYTFYYSLFKNIKTHFELLIKNVECSSAFTVALFPLQLKIFSAVFNGQQCCVQM